MPHLLMLSVALMLCLTHLKHVQKLKGLQAYTFWNLTACLANFAFRLGWERILFTNSLAVFASYKTAQADHMSKRFFIQQSGLTPMRFWMGDMIVHFFPVVLLARYLKKHRSFIVPQLGFFSLLGQTYFAYSQVGRLDVRDLYGPHDTKWAWVAAILAHTVGPSFMNNLIRDNYGKALLLGLLIGGPYLAKELGLLPQLPEPESKPVSQHFLQFSDCSACRALLCTVCQKRVEEVVTGTEHHDCSQQEAPVVPGALCTLFTKLGDVASLAALDKNKKQVAH
eukprot:g6439.t1